MSLLAEVHCGKVRLPMPQAKQTRKQTFTFRYRDAERREQMNRKIFDFAIAIISAIGAVEVLINPLISQIELLQTIPTWIVVVLHAALLLLVTGVIFL